MASKENAYYFDKIKINNFGEAQREVKFLEEVIAGAYETLTEYCVEWNVNSELFILPSGIYKFPKGCYSTMKEYNERRINKIIKQYEKYLTEEEKEENIQKTT